MEGGSRWMIWLVSALSLFSGCDAINVGYDLSTLTQSMYDNKMGYALILEPARTFFSDGVKISRITANWYSSGAAVHFQIYEPVTHSSVVRYRLKAQTQALTGFSNPAVFTQGLETLVANHGDVFGFYFPGVNPIPYNVPAFCDPNNNERFYWGLQAITAFTVGEEYHFLPAAFPEAPNCREYHVQIEVYPHAALPGVTSFGWDSLTNVQQDTQPGLVVFDDKKFDEKITLVGFTARFDRPNDKVHILVLHSVGVDKYYIDYTSDPYYVFTPQTLRVNFGANRTRHFSRGSVIGLYFEGMNPVPFEEDFGCTTGTRSVEGSIATIQNKQISVTPRSSQPCRKYAFKVFYQFTGHTGPAVTTPLVPTSCNQLTATTDEQIAQSTLQQGTEKLKSKECWQINAGSLYPYIEITGNSLAAKTGDCRLHKDVVAVHEGLSVSGKVLKQLCGSEEGDKISTCGSNGMYILVLTSTSTGSGLSFKYRAITREEARCPEPTSAPAEPGAVGSSANTPLHATLLLLLIPITLTFTYRTL